jgi:hypothetical protein
MAAIVKLPSGRWRLNAPEGKLSKKHVSTASRRRDLGT